MARLIERSVKKPLSELLLFSELAAGTTVTVDEVDGAIAAPTGADVEISIDRYLDDGGELFMTLALRSRTTEMHSVLSALDAGQRAAVQGALARALDEIAVVMIDGSGGAAEARIECSQAPVAQLDRASAFEAEGRRFEPCRARHLAARLSRHGSAQARRGGTAAANRHEPSTPGAPPRCARSPSSRRTWSAVDRHKMPTLLMTTDELRAQVQALRWYRLDRSGPRRRDAAGSTTPPNGSPACGCRRISSGRTVLDIGAWDGFFSFEAERRGARRHPRH